MSTMVGRYVKFAGWADDGEEVIFHGAVEEEFTEPPEEDPLQRLCYLVRSPEGRVHTPYAHECLEYVPCGLRAVGWDPMEI